MTKPKMNYAVAVKLMEDVDAEIYVFPSPKKRESFIKKIKTRWPDINYATADLEDKLEVK